MQQQRPLGGYIRAIANALDQQIRNHPDGSDLTPTQGMFLHHLWFRQEVLQQPTYAKDLEAFFDIRHSTVSGILQRMETAGYLTFLPNETDRRSKAVVLTQQAMETHARITERIHQTEAKLVADMTDAEAAEFRRLLQKAAHNLNVCHHSNKEGSDP